MTSDWVPPGGDAPQRPPPPPPGWGHGPPPPPQQGWTQYSSYQAYGPAPRTNPSAIAALVCGIAGFMCFLPWIAALILGYVAKGQIDRSGGWEQGRGMAIAGIVLGWVGVVIIVAYVALVIAAVATIPMTEMQLR